MPHLKLGDVHKIITGYTIRTAMTGAYRGGPVLRHASGVFQHLIVKAVYQKKALFDDES